MTLNNKGMTLVELIIVVVLIGVIVVPIGTIFISSYVAYYNDTAKIRASSEMRYALNRVFEGFREAKQDTITRVTDERVTYKVEQSDGEHNVTIYYDSADGTLKMQTDSNTVTLLNKVRNVSITKTSDGRINVKVTTKTFLAFSDPYEYTQTYDYKIRT